MKQVHLTNTESTQYETHEESINTQINALIADSHLSRDSRRYARMSNVIYAVNLISTNTLNEKSKTRQAIELYNRLMQANLVGRIITITVIKTICKHRLRRLHHTQQQALEAMELAQLHDDMTDAHQHERTYKNTDKKIDRLEDYLL